MSTVINLNNPDPNLQQRRFKDSNAESETNQQIPAAPTLSVASTVGAYVFQTGKQRAQQALNIYSHIDYLRPYFDVEPKDVLNRLLYSLVPVDRSNNILVTELYGPLMILFTLCAILIYQMKLASHAIQDGTLIGTAFFVCFSYWIGTSFLASSTSFVCNSSITLFNFLSLIGYSLFSHCVVMLIGTFIHTSFDHFLFYFLWLSLGGAAGLKLAYTVFTHTPHPRYRIGIAIGIFAIHMLFLLYIHFAYHELAEEVSHALFAKDESLPASLLNKVDSQIDHPASVVKDINRRVERSVGPNADIIIKNIVPSANLSRSR